MKHVKALLIKFAGTFSILYVILGYYYTLNILGVLLLSALLGVVAYLFGDLLILSRTNNLVGTLADFGLAWAVIYLFIDMMTASDNIFIMSFSAAVILSLFEIAFHVYMVLYVLPDNGSPERKEILQYRTEMSGELGEPSLKEKRRDH